MENSHPKIYVAGHLGMVGSAITRQLLEKGCHIISKSRAELDLTNQADVRGFFQKERPDEVYLAAGKVGGIFANNTYPADFIYENIMIEANVIDAAFRNGVKKLLFLGSSCIYPRLAPQPTTEAQLLTGKLEPTNEAYAIAKIAGIKLCESYNRQHGTSANNSAGVDFRCLMPTNLYGPGDNYHPENSHVIAALIRRFHEAKVKKSPRVSIWGTGEPRREFLFVDDMARACLHVMKLDKEIYERSTEPMCSHINVGIGVETSILELAKCIKLVTQFEGDICFNLSKPDGAPRKILDSERLRKLGWKPEVTLNDGLIKTYQDFLSSQEKH